MKSNFLTAIVACLLGMMAVPAFATKVNPKTMTCEQFLALDDVVKPKVVYWAEGVNKHGTAKVSEVDIDETDRLVPVLVTECQAAPKLSFWQKLKKHL
jgi:hypothetical protein